MEHIPPNQAFGPTINRVRDVMAHTSRYAFDGVARLAQDTGLHRTTLTRVIYGKINPSARTVARISDALERALGRKIDPRELFAEIGRFPTRYTCDLCGCPGCLPDTATDEFGDRKAAFRDVLPGRWVTSQFPNGLDAQKGV